MDYNKRSFADPRSYRYVDPMMPLPQRHFSEDSNNPSQELFNETYECSICLMAVKRRDPLWHCKGGCYKIFHLNCIRKSASSQEQTRLESNAGLTSKFSCPVCRRERDVSLLEDYMCYCGKCKEPPMDPLAVLGSCGEPCQQFLGPHCSHQCMSLCHPGPCHPCTQFREISCFCGKMGEGVHRKRVPCGSKELHFSCQQICGKTLNCGIHDCTELCHEGPCGTCTVRVEQHCFCGGMTLQKQCGDPTLDQQEEGKGSFCCGQRCNRSLSCGNHACSLLCHSGECPPCERAPSRRRFCPCGKTRLPPGEHSTQCTDPIPTCDLTCELPLPCGHKCWKQCHDDGYQGPNEKHEEPQPPEGEDAQLKRDDDKPNKKEEKTKLGEGEATAPLETVWRQCGPCREELIEACRCGRNKVKIPCFCTYLNERDWIAAAAALQMKLPTQLVGHGLPPRCGLVCRKELTCKKPGHRCTETCCVDKEHICPRICNKKLSCRVHVCGQTCHSGPCRTCDVASYDRVYCTCRKTWIEPPIPCGSKLLPNCTQPCSIPRPCGHPPLHPCHDAAEKCSLCAYPVQKNCPSHHKELPVFHACHLTNVSCGKRCGKLLSCCGATCSQPCHGGACKHKCSGTSYAALLRSTK